MNGSGAAAAIVPVVIAGGSGTRLWPLSRSARPKQFLPIGDQGSLLQQTLQRVQPLSTSEALIIANHEHRFLVAEQVREMGLSARVLLESEGRNTAPAAALAALELLVVEPQAMPIMLVLPADHRIADATAFHRAVQQLLPAVQAGAVGTLGIVPTFAATGYGYIRTADALAESLWQVSAFVEKPAADKAQQLIDAGCLWNSGMFLVRADRYLQLLRQYAPAVAQACRAAMAAKQQDLDFLRPDADAFGRCPADSIDYALMEPLAADGGNIVVAALAAGWSDIGSWSALWDISEQDAQGNAVVAGQSRDDVVFHDSRDCLVSHAGRLVATLGVQGLVIADTPDALLVADKRRAQDVRALVEALLAQGREESLQHREVFRPWGKYDSLIRGDGFLVKLIRVNPGARISRQRHQHRAEHWIVVSGTARVTNGERVYAVQRNESTFIAQGTVHCLENPGPDMLEIIEIQSGDYLSEDDIQRLQDDYGRSN